MESIRSVLSVDRTFNVSTLFVTVTVFKHKAVVRKNSGDFLLFLGPVLLHGDGQFGTFILKVSTRRCGLFCIQLRIVAVQNRLLLEYFVANQSTTEAAKFPAAYNLPVPISASISPASQN